MPHGARKSSSGKGYDIVRKDTGKVVGHSSSKGKAEASARARDAAAHGWKPNQPKK